MESVLPRAIDTRTMFCRWPPPCFGGARAQGPSPPRRRAQCSIIFRILRHSCARQCSMHQLNSAVRTDGGAFTFTRAVNKPAQETITASVVRVQRAPHHRDLGGGARRCHFLPDLVRFQLLLGTRARVLMLGSVGLDPVTSQQAAVHEGYCNPGDVTPNQLMLGL